MTFKLRPVLTLLAVAALAWTMTPSWGFYSTDALIAALAALVLAVAACTCPDRQWRVSPLVGRIALLGACAFLLIEGWHSVGDPSAQPPLLIECLILAMILLAVATSLRRRPPQSLPAALLASLALVLSANAIFAAELWSAQVTDASLLLQPLACAGFVLVATLLLHLAEPGRWPRLLWIQVLLLFAIGTALRISAIMAVPNPKIDVYTALRDAPYHLLHGRNPYATAYEWPYAAGPDPRYDAPPFYPPLPFLLALPCRVTALDVRYTNVALDLLAALVLFAAARLRGSPLVGALLAGIYLCFPHVPFLMEQAWYEPMLAALLGSGLLLVENDWQVGYWLLGLGLTGKQYGIAMLGPLLKAQGRRWWRLMLGVALAATVVLLPFFFWDPQAFLDVVFFKHLKRPIIAFSVTLHVGADRLLHRPVSRSLLWGLAVLLIGLVTWRTPTRGIAAGLWTGTALLAFCLCHSQGFYNYFYLCQYLLLLSLAGLFLSDEHRPA